MQIDWFTVGAQVVNFLILVYLLKRFLYGPIVNAMEQRERRVTDRLREAKERGEEAEERARELQRQRDELDERRDELLAEAREEAEQHREELFQAARGEVDDARSRWRKELDRDRESLVRELRGQAASWVTTASRRALRDLVDVELEERVVVAFQDRIRKLDSDERDRLGEAVRAAEKPLRVVTTFELSEEQREDLREALEDELGEAVDLRFAESADLVCGVELRTPGVSLAFSLDAFANDLEERIEEALADATAEPTRGSEGRSSASEEKAREQESSA